MPVTDVTQPAADQIDLPFSRAEYADRLARVRAAMAQAGVDTLITVGSLEHGLADGL